MLKSLLKSNLPSSLGRFRQTAHLWCWSWTSLLSKTKNKTNNNIKFDTTLKQEYFLLTQKGIARKRKYRHHDLLAMENPKVEQTTIHSPGVVLNPHFFLVITFKIRTTFERITFGKWKKDSRNAQESKQSQKACLGGRKLLECFLPFFVQET